MLRMHPQVWMPPLKELHYFDRSASYSSPKFLACDSPFHRLLGREPHNRQFRFMLRQLLRRAARDRDWALLRWTVTFGFGVVNYDWYRSLFARAPAAIRGEITPSYMILGHGDIAKIRQLAPDLKVILLLRNPIDRAWSQMRFDSVRVDFGQIENIEAVRKFIDSPHQTLRGDYPRALEIWTKEFSNDRVFVGFYDDIVEQPSVLLRSVLKFLGADSSLSLPADKLRKRVHVSKQKEMPPSIHHYLAQKYRADLIALAATFGGHPERWRRAAEPEF